MITNYKEYYDIIAPKYITWEFYSKYVSLEPPFSKIGKLVYLRTYSRFIEQLKRREKWCEICLRVAEYSLSLDTISSFDDKKKEAELLFEYLFNLISHVAGRTYWIGGTEQTKKDASANWNCVYRNLDDLSSFTELFYWLLIGAGTGFSVEKKYISQLPQLYPNKVVTHLEYVEEENKLEHTKFDITYFNYQIFSTILTKESLTISDKEFNERYINRFNSIKKVVIAVGDSKEGWCNALRLYLQLLTLPYSFNIEFNYNNIRSKGKRIKTFGGRASGYANLKRCIELITEELLTTDGVLTSLVALTMMCIIGDTVVSGGVRRTAEDGLGDKDDIEFIEAKYGMYEKPELAKYKNIRDNSNNSVMYYERPTYEELEFVINRARYNGEPGLCIIGNAQKYDAGICGFNPSLRAGTRVLTDKGIFEIQDLENKENLVVPTLPSKFANAVCRLSGKNKQLYKVTLVGGKSYYATAEHKWPTLTKEVVSKKTTLELESGDKLPITKVDKLYYSTNGTYKEGFFVGWLLGDGWITTRGDNGKTQIGMVVSDSKLEAEQPLLDFLISIGVNVTFTQRDNGTKEFNTQNVILDTLLNKFGVVKKQFGLPTSVWNNTSEEFRKGLIDGLFSSDGTVDTSSNRICITSSKIKLIEDISDLLGFYGIKSSVRKQVTTNAKFPNGKDYGKEYATYMLRISDAGSIRHFNKLFTLTVSAKQNKISRIADQPRLRSKDHDYILVETVEKTDIYEDVWDLSVYDETHTFKLSHCITGNCFESGLHSKQSCNLTTNNLVNCIDLVDGKYRLNELLWFTSLYLTTRVASRQTTATQWHPEWDKVQKQQRLLGVSITGIMDAVELLGWTNKELEQFFIKSKEYVRKVADEYHKELGIERSARVTLVKPEGSISKLTGVSEGIHRAYAPYFINRIRFSSNDPLAKVLFNEGVPVCPENGQGTDLFSKECNTWVFTFAAKSATKVRYIDEDAITQLERYKLVQQHWVDGGHNCSITVSVYPHEWDDVIKWVYDNWEYVIAVSFLERFDPTEGSNTVYPNIPKETCTYEKYLEVDALLPNLTEDELIEGIAEFELEDNEYSLDSSCDSGFCPTR